MKTLGKSLRNEDDQNICTKFPAFQKKKVQPVSLPSRKQLKIRGSKDSTVRLSIKSLSSGYEFAAPFFLSTSTVKIPCQRSARTGARVGPACHPLCRPPLLRVPTTNNTVNDALFSSKNYPSRTLPKFHVQNPCDAHPSLLSARQ
jgi:hypothetical protein